MFNSRLQTIAYQHPCPRLHKDCTGLVIALLITMAAAAWAGPVLAVHASSDDSPTATRVNVSASQAARAARHQYGGKVLSVMLDANSKAPYYRVKLLSAGQVRVVHVTAIDKPRK